MKRMSSGDDLDERFNALVAQFGEGEQRKMRDAATKAAREAERARKKQRQREEEPPQNAYTPRWKIWLAVWLIVAIVAASGAIVAFRPDLLAP